MCLKTSKVSKHACLGFVLVSKEELRKKRGKFSSENSGNWAGLVAKTGKQLL